MIDLATLTGAARVALGAQLPALFCRRMELARALVDRGLALHDPLWHLPLWRGYHAGIESDIADIVNTGRNAMAGAINAALFLEDFVPGRPGLAAHRPLRLERHGAARAGRWAARRRPCARCWTTSRGASCAGQRRPEAACPAAARRGAADRA